MVNSFLRQFYEATYWVHPFVEYILDRFLFLIVQTSPFLSYLFPDIGEAVHGRFYYD